MKRAGLYMRVSTVDQHPETQLLDLRQMAAQRGYEIVAEYTDKISGTKAKRPGLDQMMTDARRGRFDVVLVWASDRIARSVKHFLEVLDELNRLEVEYVSFRENIDTGGPLGRAIVVIIGAIAELERSLIVERVRAGMRRARLEGQPHRPQSAGPGQRRHPTRPPAGPEPPTDRQRPPHLNGHCTAGAPQVRSDHPGECRMIEHTLVLFIYSVIIIALAIYIYVITRGQVSTCELRRTFDQILASAESIKTDLKQQRSVLNDAHRKICAVTKSLEKPSS